MDVLRLAAPGAIFLLNSPYGPDEVWDHLPRAVQQQIIDKKLRFYVIDASKVARDAGLGSRTNTILQTCFFAISGVLPRDEAIDAHQGIDRKTYGEKGEKVVRRTSPPWTQRWPICFEVKVPATRDEHVRPAADRAGQRARHSSER